MNVLPSSTRLDRAWPELQLRHALIQSPMAGVQDHRLAVAVSQCGALGSLPAALWDAATLDRELELTRRALSESGQAFNVNFFCHRPPEPDTQARRRWQGVLEPYAASWGIRLDPGPEGPVRQPFSSALAAVLEQHRPPVVSFHFGLPDPALLDRVKAWGARILSSATTVQEALWLADHGADAIVVQGLEAGGHRGHFLRPDLQGQGPLLQLLAEMVPAIPLPLIAAGGLMRPQDVARAFEAGAAAVQVGTAFLLCPQAQTPAVHRAALQQRPPGQTALTNLFSGRPARGIINRLMREIGPLCDAAPAFPLASLDLMALRQAAEAQGLSDFSPLWCGTGFAECTEQSAQSVVQHLMERAP